MGKNKGRLSKGKPAGRPVTARPAGRLPPPPPPPAPGGAPAAALVPPPPPPRQLADGGAALDPDALAALASSAAAGAAARPALAAAGRAVAYPAVHNEVVNRAPKPGASALLDGRQPATPAAVTHAARNIAPAELESIRRTGFALPPEGGSGFTGGQDKWWSGADERGSFGRSWKAGADARTVRAPIDAVSSNRAVPAKALQVMNPGSGAWEPVAPQRGAALGTMAKTAGARVAGGLASAARVAGGAPATGLGLLLAPNNNLATQAQEDAALAGYANGHTTGGGYASGGAARRPCKADGGPVFDARHGGRVPTARRPGVDQVPAMLDAPPGGLPEYVLPGDTTAAVGIRNLDALRAATHDPRAVARRRAAAPAGGLANWRQARRKADGGADYRPEQGISPTMEIGPGVPGYQPDAGGDGTGIEGRDLGFQNSPYKTQEAYDKAQLLNDTANYRDDTTRFKSHWQDKGEMAGRLEGLAARAKALGAAPEASDAPVAAPAAAPPALPGVNDFLAPEPLAPLRRRFAPAPLALTDLSTGLGADPLAPGIARLADGGSVTYGPWAPLAGGLEDYVQAQRQRAVYGETGAGVPRVTDEEIANRAPPDTRQGALGGLANLPQERPGAAPTDVPRSLAAPVTPERPPPLPGVFSRQQAESDQANGIGGTYGSNFGTALKAGADALGNHVSSGYGDTNFLEAAKAVNDASVNGRPVSAPAVARPTAAVVQPPVALPPAAMAAPQYPNYPTRNPAVQGVLIDASKQRADATRTANLRQPGWSPGQATSADVGRARAGARDMAGVGASAARDAAGAGLDVYERGLAAVTAGQFPGLELRQGGETASSGPKGGQPYAETIKDRRAGRRKGRPLGDFFPATRAAAAQANALEDAAPNWATKLNAAGRGAAGVLGALPGDVGHLVDRAVIQPDTALVNWLKQRGREIATGEPAAQAASEGAATVPSGAATPPAPAVVPLAPPSLDAPPRMTPYRLNEPVNPLSGPGMKIAPAVVNAIDQRRGPAVGVPQALSDAAARGPQVTLSSAAQRSLAPPPPPPAPGAASAFTRETGPTSDARLKAQLEAAGGRMDRTPDGKWAYEMPPAGPIGYDSMTRQVAAMGGPNWDALSDANVARVTAPGFKTSGDGMFNPQETLPAQAAEQGLALAQQWYGMAPKERGRLPDRTADRMGVAREAPLAAPSEAQLRLQLDAAKIQGTLASAAANRQGELADRQAARDQDLLLKGLDLRAGASKEQLAAAQAWGKSYRAALAGGEQKAGEAMLGGAAAPAALSQEGWDFALERGPWIKRLLPHLDENTIAGVTRAAGRMIPSRAKATADAMQALGAADANAPGVTERATAIIDAGRQAADAWVAQRFDQNKG